MEVFEFIEWLEKASSHTKKQIERVKELIESGKTYTIEDEMKLHDELNKDKPKLRIKFNNEN